LPSGRLESKGDERALSNGTLGEASEAAFERVIRANFAGLLDVYQPLLDQWMFKHPAALEKHPDLTLEYPH
jgi:hypothetical protein